MSPHPHDIREEQIRMVRLRVYIDLISYRLGHVPMSRQDALQMIERARQEILELCPGKESVFELVLRPRFLRILNERAITAWGVAGSTN